MVFVTDRPTEIGSRNDMRVEVVPSLRSRADYSLIVQAELALFIRTPFVLLVQWDGYPVRPANWNEAFLDYDYIGAPWPQFPAYRAVGNGGFSLRSRRLLEAGRDPDFEAGHPEDVVICHRNRSFLEGRYGLRFAPIELASRFAYERMGDPARSFGFHGLFNMPHEMEMEAFSELMGMLDLRMIGVRELSDLREVLIRADDVQASRLSHGLLSHLMRDRWRDVDFWRYLRRKMMRRLSELLPVRP